MRFTLSKQKTVESFTCRYILFGSADSSASAVIAGKYVKDPGENKAGFADEPRKPAYRNNNNFPEDY